MWEKVDDYVRKYDLLREGDAVLVGLSGGADSVCLLRYLLAVRERMPVRLFAVHVNHMLREEEADRDREVRARPLRPVSGALCGGAERCGRREKKAALLSGRGGTAGAL